MADFGRWRRRKKRTKKAAAIRIDDFVELSEAEQVERVKAMLRALGKPNDDHDHR